MLSRDEVPTRTLSLQRERSADLNLRPAAAGGFGRSGPGGTPSGGRTDTGRMHPSKSVPSMHDAEGRPRSTSGAGGQRGGGAPATPAPTPTPVAVATPVEAPAKPLPAEKLKLKASNLVEEYWASKRVEDAVANLADMREAGADMAAALPALFDAALNIRGIDVGERLGPIIATLDAALEKGVPEGLSPSELADGCRCACVRVCYWKDACVFLCV